MTSPSEFKSSEERRYEDEMELAAQTALEFTCSAPLSALLTQSSLKSSNGSVEIFECSVDLVEALMKVAEGIDGKRLGGVLEKVRDRMRSEVFNGSGFVLLRKLPLHASPTWSKMICEALMGSKSLGNFQKTESCGLTNDAPSPKGPPTVVCGCCCAPANRATVARFARVEDILLSLSADTKHALKQNHHLDDNSEPGPLLSQDDDYRYQLRYSPGLKEAVEWHPQVSAATCSALTALEGTTRDAAIGIAVPLRADDVFIFDTKRWLYALDLKHDTQVECRFLRGTWMPSFALVNPEDKENAHLLPSQPIISRFWF